MRASPRRGFQKEGEVSEPPGALRSLLVAEAAVQRRQVERGVAQAPPVALVPVAFALRPREDQPVEVVQEAVCGTEDILHPEAV